MFFEFNRVQLVHSGVQRNLCIWGSASPQDADVSADFMEFHIIAIVSRIKEVE
jgi:hypothetical protein